MNKKRTRKPPISPEQRSEWLKRHERNGETPPQIAEADGVDDRTVRKHLGLAQRESEMREARTTLLRDALRDHYYDIHRVIKQIETCLSSEQSFNLDDSDDLRLKALRQHMPRSPMLQNIRKFNNSINEINAETDFAKNKINTCVENKITNLSISSQFLKEGLVNAFVHQLKQWTKGYPGFNIKENFFIESKDNSMCTVRYGAFQLGEITEKDVEPLKKMIEDFETNMRNWEELRKLQSKYNNLRSIRDRVLKEIGGIRMRRIFSGKCEFCPL